MPWLDLQEGVLSEFAGHIGKHASRASEALAGYRTFYDPSDEALRLERRKARCRALWGQETVPEHVRAHKAHLRRCYYHHTSTPPAKRRHVRGRVESALERRARLNADARERWAAKRHLAGLGVRVGLAEEVVRKIRTMGAQGVQRKAIAKQLGISHHTVGRILLGKAYVGCGKI